MIPVTLTAIPHDAALWHWGDGVSTCYPLGLFRARSNLELRMHCLVYPRPGNGDRYLKYRL
jgi:hypothetical protein